MEDWRVLAKRSSERQAYLRNSDVCLMCLAHEELSGLRYEI